MNTSINTGIAGEYFVAAELSRRGYIASITLRNSEGIDILCTNSDGTKTINIQVKSSKLAKPTWLLNKKVEDNYNPNLFYIFVCLKGTKELPDYYIVPSQKVAEYAKKSHSGWLKGMKNNGEARKNTGMRKFDDVEKKFLGKWSLLFGESLVRE